ncbi:MAG: glycosyltransferase family 2 protein [Bacteroidales bacterium]|nr:glycosyltransferase family 2 protein [Bacteroidales bacterium]
MDISVVVPLLNEEDSLDELHQWIVRAISGEGLTYEIIFVDDGSNDTSWQVIEKICRNDSHVKGIRFRRNYGKSAALNSGFRAAGGEVVITMDADLQDSPDEIPGLYRMIHDEGFDLVSGWKKRRHDPVSKTIPSRFFNWVTRRTSSIKLHDFNCGLKAYRLDVVKSIEIYGEMHRYIPVIANYAGFTRIGEKVVEHQSRKFGVTKFGIDRFLKGYLDLLSITFVSKFGRRPMHLFGMIGTLMFFLGFLAAAWIGAQKLYFLHHGIRTILVVDSPYFYLSLTLMIIGSQLFLAGFLAEMISRTSPERNRYLISKTLNISESDVSDL